jgi:Lrp/AsnC family leucine-responsive transcriptional regulator
MSTARLDEMDRKILDHLRQDARAPVSLIARSVGLSAAPVTRRIQRLERVGVIRGYVALVDERSSGDLEAFTEIRLHGDTDTGELFDVIRGLPEVREFFTIAGDPDVLVRIRVRDLDHLQRVVNAMRRTGKVTGTKTLVVLFRWNRELELNDR